VINFERGVSKAGRDEKLETAFREDVVEPEALCEGQESKTREFEVDRSNT
jgi:hypothetical protein